MRLVRAHDPSLSWEQYVELALSLQVGLGEMEAGQHGAVLGLAGAVCS